MTEAAVGDSSGHTAPRDAEPVKRGRSLGWKFARLGLGAFALMGALLFTALYLCAQASFGEIEDEISADHADRIRAVMAYEPIWIGDPALGGAPKGDALDAALARASAIVGLPLEVADKPGLEGFEIGGSARSPYYRRDSGDVRLLLVPFEGIAEGEVRCVSLSYTRSSDRAARRLLLESALAYVLAAAITVLALMFSARRFALRPLLRMASHMDRAAAGAFEAPLALGAAAGRRDEIGILADRADLLIATERRRTQELAAANQELELRAATDALTGLPNRRSFAERLERERRRLIRERFGPDSDQMAFVICDIDCFKRYNDLYGHGAGDDCLRAVAAAIAGALRRPTDLACRQGGEEFLVMLPGTETAGAGFVAESIRKAVEGLGLPHGDSPVAPVVTLSLGVAAVVCDEAFDSEALFRRADKALYEAKAAGRNRVRISGA